MTRSQPTMNLPDFIIIGAMKSGTTTLQAQLSSQPGVFMSTPKEPNFFSDDAVYAQGADWYKALFEMAAPGDIKGEASTHYTKLPTYPETVPRLAVLVPAPKLIYVIRNPIARAVSHYIHEWSEGRMSADPEAAFTTYPELVAYGRYPMQLAPFVEQFGIEQIYLTSLEQLTTDPNQELQRIGSHLGIPSPAIWNHDMKAQNVSADRVRKLPMHGLLVDNPVARVLRRSLVPKSLRTSIRRGRTLNKRPELPQSLHNELEKIFAQDLPALAQLFPDHAALGRCYAFAQT